MFRYVLALYREATVVQGTLFFFGQRLAFDGVIANVASVKL